MYLLWSYEICIHNVLEEFKFQPNTCYFLDRISFQIQVSNCSMNPIKLDLGERQLDK